MDDKQKVKEESWSRFQNDFIWRGGTIHEAWQSGFDAGLAHAQQWVEIAKDGLPKEDGEYLVLGEHYEITGADVLAFEADACGLVDMWKERIIAYMPIPPFTPKETTV